MISREPYIRAWQELAQEKNMVFLSGPRQSGKTTLARKIYLWDYAQIQDPAVQLTGRGDSYHLFNSGERQLLVAPAAAWLSQLP